MVVSGLDRRLLRGDRFRTFLGRRWPHSGGVMCLRWRGRHAWRFLPLVPLPLGNVAADERSSPGDSAGLLLRFRSSVGDVAFRRGRWAPQHTRRHRHCDVPRIHHGVLGMRTPGLSGRVCGGAVEVGVTTPADLDGTIHSPKRLAAMAILASNTTTDFSFLRE